MLESGIAENDTVVLYGILPPNREQRRVALAFGSTWVPECTLLDSAGSLGPRTPVGNRLSLSK